MSRGPVGMPRMLAAALALLVPAAGTLAGCGLPTPPGVRVDRPISDDSLVEDAPEIRKLPSGPVAGQSPEQVVQGFLDAVGASSDSGHALAREFLVPGIPWDDGGGRTVYDATTLATTVGGSASAPTVSLRAQELARIGGDGGLRPSGAALRLALRLVRTGEGWRIRSLPAGSWLTPRDLSRGYTIAVLWTGGRDGGPMRPEPVAVAGERAALPGAVMRTLLARLEAEGSLPGGSGAGTAGAPSSPSGGVVGLVGSVLLDGRRAVVDLSRSVYALDDDVRARLVAETASTLGSLPSVDTVRVLGDGRLLPGGDVAAVDPPGPTDVGPGVALRDDVSVSMTTEPGGAGVHVGGAPGGRVSGVVQSAVPGPADRLALIPPAGAAGTEARLILRRPGVADQALLPSVAGHPGRWTAATWLPDGSLLAALEGRRPAIALVAPDGSVREVGALPAVAGPVRELAADPTGTTIAAVAGPAGAGTDGAGTSGTGAAWLARTGVGTVTSLRAAGWLPAPASVTGVTAVGWTDGLDLVIAGAAPARTDAGAAPAGPVLDVLHLTAPTASTTAATDGLPAVVDGVAAAPGRPVVVGSAGGLWRQSGSGWVRIGPGRAPAWP